MFGFLSPISRKSGKVLANSLLRNFNAVDTRRIPKSRLHIEFVILLLSIYPRHRDFGVVGRSIRQRRYIQMCVRCYSGWRSLVEHFCFWSGKVTDLNCGCIGRRSNLATNTTLTGFRLWRRIRRHPFGVLVIKGRISLKIACIPPILRASATPFKGTCFPLYY